MKIRKSWAAAIGALALAITTAASMAFFTDRVESDLQISTATFTGDGYTLSRTFTEGTYGGGNIVEIGIMESSTMDEAVSSSLDLISTWTTTSGIDIFGNANAADNVSFLLGGKPISYTVTSAGKVQLNLPKQEISAKGSAERTLQIQLPDSLSAAGTFTLEFEKAIVSQSPVGFTREYDKATLNSPVDLTVSFETQKPIPTLKKWTDSAITDFHAYKSTITNISIVDEATTPSSSYAGPWDISEAKDGSVTAWMPDSTSVVISGNGSGYIKANTDSSYIFFRFDKLTSISGLDLLDTSSTTKMNGVFQFCNSITDLDLSEWDTSKVTQMYDMFQHCTSLTHLNLKGWDTSSVTNTSFMFYNCQSLVELNLDNWDTSSVTEMSSMFKNCYNLTRLDLSGWDTSSITSSRYAHDIFTSCTNLQEITLGSGIKDFTKFQMRNLPALNKIIFLHGANDVVKMPTAGSSAGAFYVDNFVDTKIITENPTIKNYNWAADHRNPTIKKVPTLQRWRAYAATDFHTYIREITNIKIVDEAAAPESLYAGPWDISEVKDGSVTAWMPDATSVVISGNGSGRIKANANSSYLFDSFRKLTKIEGLELLDTSSVTNMNHMFSDCTKLTSIGGLNSWNTSSVTDMSWMFSRSNFDSLNGISNWDTSAVTNMSGMFYYTEFTNLDSISRWNTSSVTDMNSMFQGCEHLSSLELNEWDTSAVTNMSYMFYNCRSITNLDGISNWNTSAVTDMSRMFGACSVLINLDGISEWNTASVVNMEYMFFTSRSITNLDSISGWNTSAVKNMTGMFYDCINLNSLDLSKWDVSSVTSTAVMFNDCSALISAGDLSGWNTSSMIKMGSMFDECHNLIGVGDLSSWKTSNVTDINHMFSDCYALTSLNLSGWDVRNVKNMSAMFIECSSLTSLDLSEWNVTDLVDMKWMFQGCNNLTTVFVKDETNQNRFKTRPTITPSQVQFIIKTASNALSFDLNGGEVAGEHSLTYDLNGGKFAAAA